MSFACRDTQALFEGRRCARFRNIESVALRRLQPLNAAVTLSFLRMPPGNRLEPLCGDRDGQWSLRINGQWRLCFHWEDGHAHRVAIVDYH